MVEINAPVPENEKDRLKALERYKIMDTLPEQEFEDIAKLASYICNVPIAHVSFIDEERQWFKAKVGMDAYDMPREETFCQHTIMQNELLVTPNALYHETFKHNPHVSGDFHIRFYAGIPLTTPDGYNIGTLCVVDTEPGNLTDEQRLAMSTLAKHVMAQLELRVKNSDLNTEVKRLAEKELEAVTQELKSYKLALDKTSGVIVFGTDGIISFANENSAEICRDKDIKLIGKHISEINACYEDKTFLNEMWEDISKGEVWKKEIISNAENGNIYWTDILVVPIKNEEGKPFKYVKILTDITDRKLAEEDLKSAKEAAEKAIFAKDSFLANMSHEIRTPMNAIIGFTDLLAQTNLSSQQSEFVTNVQTAGDNLLLIINDILDLSKIESGMLVIESNPFNLKNVLKHVYDLLKVKAQQKGLDFNLFLDADMPEVVMGDKGRINQIVMNLAGNAIKFTEKGEVTISVKKIIETDKKYTLKFLVKDTGIGIPENKLKTIFDRFTQAEDSTTRRFGGTGLGLNIVKQLLDMLGSEIEVKSKEYTGSEFFFVIDFNKAQGHEENIIMKTTEKKIEEMGRLSILLCEDNILNQHLARSIIESFNFTLDIANNGDEGINMLQKNKYDLVLMDLQMPVMDGYQATEYIRLQMKSDIPIIAITAHSLIGEQQKCFDLGMNAYVSKPFKQEELLTQMKKAVKKE